MASLMDTLRAAGFSGSGLQTAYAVAMAESGGNAQAHNGNAGTGDNSYGLFQINMLGGMGPERRQQYGLSSNEDLFNAERNAKIAYQMSNGGTDWSPWSTYKNGAYRQYLGQSDAGVTGTDAQPAAQAAEPAAVQSSMDPTIQDFAPNTPDFAPGTRDFADPVRQQQDAGGDQIQWTTETVNPAGAKAAARYAQSDTAFRDQVIANALGFLGTRYSWGGGTRSGTSYGVAGAKYNGTGINGLDCSGLMIAAFGLSGYNLPRIAKQQLATGQTTKISSLRPGDMIGYGDGYHVALYLGDGIVVDSLPGKGVTVRAIGAWEQREGWGVHLNLPGD